MTSNLENPRWLALTASRRKELLERYRDVNVDSSWWYECIYEDFKSDLKEIGIKVTDISFSGFWSQGDGASFEGYIRDFEKLLKEIGEERFIPIANDEGWTVRIRQSGRYYTMSLDADMPLPVNPYDEDDDPLRHAAWADGRVSESEVNELEDTILARVQVLADGLYKFLEVEYDYQTDDEQVVEFLLANMSDEELKGDEDDEVDEVDEADKQEHSACT